MTRINITSPELAELSHLLLQRTGIALGENKRYLFEHRLSGILDEFQFFNYHDLYTAIQSEPAGSVAQAFIDAMVTGETAFFRDGTPFDFVAQWAPELVRKRLPGPCNIQIWSAACASGQEAYSLAITLWETLGPLRALDCSILGTDISPAAIAKARAGIYSKYEMARGITYNRLMKHFEQSANAYAVDSELRQLVHFKKHNLIGDFVGLGSFDLIFCRNVAVYFGQREKEKLLKQLESRLKPGGILVLGSTESLVGMTLKLKRCEFREMLYYQKEDR